MKPQPEPIIEIYAYQREIVNTPTYYFDNSIRWEEGGTLVIQRTRSGRGFYEDESGHHLVTPGKAMLFQHGEASKYGYLRNDTEPYVFDFIAMKGPGADVIFKAVRERYGSIINMPDFSEGFLLFREIGRMYSERRFRDRFHRSAKIFELLFTLLRPLPQEHGADPIEQARDYISDHFDSPIRIKEAAHKVGLSREHLTRQFRERFGEGPGEFCRRLRLERARNLLRATSAPITSISQQCGYGDPDSFSRAYERHFKIAPGRDRAQARGDLNEGG